MYSGKTLEDCLNKAREELGITNEEIQYEIIEESKKIFSKKCKIKVINEGISRGENEINRGDIKKEDDIKVEDNEIKILIPAKNLKLNFDEEKIDIYVNDELAKNNDVVNDDDKITYKFKCENIKARREVKIDTTPVEAKITIMYEPSYINEVKCELKYGSVLDIDVDMVEGDKGPTFTGDEIIKILKDKKITYGIDDEAIKKATSIDGVEELVIAKGIPPIDDTPDRIKIFFESLKNNLANNDIAKVDYRNAKSITNVKMGEELGEIVYGEDGKDGIDIYGNVIKRKLKKCLQLKVGTGCKIKENKVVSIIEGQPSLKSGVFYVHKVYEINESVDIKSGNINFIGDVKVNKDILDGMTVEAGNSVVVMGNVEAATVIAHGESVFEGSILNSTIKIGAQDIMNEMKLEDLQIFTKELSVLLASIQELKKKHLLEDKKDGEIIKALIDSKFRNFTKKAMAVLKHSGDENFDKIKSVIKTKLLGLGPLSIKFANDLYHLKEWLEEEIQPLKENLFIPVDVHINYVQDSEIKTTGNVIIEGKGQYTSTITSFGDIIFVKDNAVCRGGELVARGNIKAKTLGSTAGISTILKGTKDSVITADLAYNNTVFYFDERRYVLEVPSKDVKAYLDEKGEIVVEKFVL